jgi:putative MATE family efflux protein
MICENAVNIGVAFTLVRGLGPVPRLGWDGLAYAAMCGYITTALIVMARLLVGRYGLRIDWRLMRPDFSLIRRLLRIGIPGGADVLSIVACQFWFLSIVNRLGNVSAGAHGVAITIESLAYLPGSAFGVASMTLVGQCLGARDDRRAVQSVRLAMFACCGLMTAIACCYYFAANSLAGWFVGPEQPEIGELSATLVRIVAFGQPPLAVLMVMNGALRGAGDTRFTLAATFIGFLGVRMPLAYWLAWDAVNIHWGSLDLHLQCRNLGVRGAWYAMLADMTVRALLVLWRFSRGQWKRIEV